MLHINDFKFRLKEHLDNASLDNHSGMVKTNPELIPFNKNLPDSRPSILVTLGPKSSSTSSIEEIKKYYGYTIDSQMTPKWLPKPYQMLPRGLFGVLRWDRNMPFLNREYLDPRGRSEGLSGYISDMYTNYPARALNLGRGL